MKRDGVGCFVDTYSANIFTPDKQVEMEVVSFVFLIRRKVSLCFGAELIFPRRWFAIIIVRLFARESWEVFLKIIISSV